MGFQKSSDYFYSCLSSGYYRDGQNKYFWGSTFDIEKNDPLAISVSQCSYSLIRFSYTALFELMKTVKLLLFLAICPDFSESSHSRNWNFSMKPVYLLLLNISWPMAFTLVTQHTGNSFFTLSLLLVHVRYSLY